jgi:TonB family protein
VKSFLTFAVAALLSCGAGLAREPSVAAQAQGAKPAAAGAQAESPELAEAARLNAEVVRLHGEGKYGEALPLAKRVLELREQALGTEHRLFVSAVNNLAALHREKGNSDEAEKLYLRILPVVEKEPGKYGALVPDIFNQLAITRFKKGDKAAAESYLQRGLSLQEKIAGPGHTTLVPFLFNSFEFYMTRKEYERAAPFLERALDILSKQPPRSDPATAKRLRNYYCLLSALKYDELAAKIYGARVRVEDPERALEAERRWAAMNDRETAGATRPIEGSVLNGKAVSKPAPEYPAAAKQQRLSGTVVVEIEVNEAGKVVKAQAICGHPVLMKASEEAARQARFTPTLLSGKPVKVSGVITYNFVLL